MNSNYYDKKKVHNLSQLLTNQMKEKLNQLNNKILQELEEIDKKLKQSDNKDSKKETISDNSKQNGIFENVIKKLREWDV